MKTASSRAPAQKESSVENPPRTRPARRAPPPRYPRITTSRPDAYFAASAAGAKETTSTRGSAHQLGSPRRGCAGAAERAQESTQASAPQAPGRLGREDARALGVGILRSRRQVSGHHDV